MVEFLQGEDPFPDPREANEHGLLAVGGDLQPQRLLEAYRSGIFPWYEDGLPILWHSPDPRMLLPVSELVVSRSLKKQIRRKPYVLTMDRAFEAVIRSCARIPRPDQDGTWITAEMISAYVELHRLGYAHSVEAWQGDELVGGLYGVAVGGLFCGESMFATADDASKIAFVHLVRQLERWNFEAVDCQVHTSHLARFGAREWPRERFLAELVRWRKLPERVGQWSLDESDP